jgi:hypothetical protein
MRFMLARLQKQKKTNVADLSHQIGGVFGGVEEASGGACGRTVGGMDAL